MDCVCELWVKVNSFLPEYFITATKQGTTASSFSLSPINISFQSLLDFRDKPVGKSNTEQNTPPSETCVGQEDKLRQIGEVYSWLIL